MLNVTKIREGDELTIKLSGGIDTNTASQLEKEVYDDLKVVKKITLDCKELTYLSSAGIRVMIMMKRVLGEHDGELVILNVEGGVKEVFNVTGLSTSFDID